MNFFKQLVIFFYQNSALYFIKKKRPIIIGVTGSAGKSTAVGAIASTLNVLFPNVEISYSKKQYNGEIGLPLSLFEIQESDSSIKTHVKNIYIIIRDLLFRKNRPRIYILEYGIDYPEEMKKLVSIVSPDFTLFTGIGTVHFGDRNKTLDAKRQLAEHTKKVVITDDDPIYQEKANNLKCDHFTIGDEGKICIEDIALQENEGKWTQKAMIKIGESTYNISTNSIDKHIFLGIGAGILFAEIISHQYHYSINTLQSIYIETKQAPGRFNIINGYDESIIIDSSYNSSPLSFIETFNQFLSIKKQFFPKHIPWVFIGDMRELYENETQAHKEICSLMIEGEIEKYFLVGDVMSNLVYNGLKGRGVKEINIFHGKYSYIIGQTIKKQIQETSEKVVIFVKGSQNTIFLEEGIKEFIGENQDKSLCRQTNSWITKKKQLGYYHNI